MSRRRSPTAGNAGNGHHWIRDEKRLRIYARDGFACVWCGAYVAKPGTSSHARVACLDHVLPRANGGSNEASNLVTSCLACNEERGTLPALSWVNALALEFDDPSLERAVIMDRLLRATGAPLPPKEAA